RWGLMPLHRSGRTSRQNAVDRALDQVHARDLGQTPVGVMSGGELQRVRIAQALATDPVLLLCDEPLLNLDPANARLVAGLIDQRRRAGTAVLFVTHEVNPVLPYVDRVLYLVGGRFRIGTVAEVMTSETLSALYQADIQVVQVGDRSGKSKYVVVGEHLDHSGHTHGHTHE
nr:ATP-binding cassette domain-containing protein [Mycobacterium sp.]